MRKLGLIAVCLATGLSLAPPEALACGSTLFGTGQGARFQPYRARVAAEVLIYASPQLAASSAADEAGIQAGLKQAGHSVTVVSTPEALASALGSAHYDVVIASAGDAETVAGQIDGRGARTDILPLVDRTTAVAGFSASDYAQSLRASAGIGQYLRSINKLMELRLK